MMVHAESGARAHHSRHPAMVAWLFQEKAEPRQAAFTELAALAGNDERFLWIDLGGSHATELQALAQELHLPEGALAAIRAKRRQPRVSVFGDVFVVMVLIPRPDPHGGDVRTDALSLIVGRNYLVSVHAHPVPFADRVMERAVQHPALLKLDSAFLLSILIDELLGYLETLAEGVEDEIEAIEERALADLSDAFLADLLALKRYVFAVFRLAGQNRAVITALLRPDFPLAGGEVITPYFRDLQDRLGRLLDELGAAKESVNGAFDLYVSQVSRRTNDIMKVLAVVSTVLLPTTVILGFFGTSFQNPPIATRTGFIIMVMLIVLMTAGILLVFYRWQWIGRAATLDKQRRRRGQA